MLLKWPQRRGAKFGVPLVNPLFDVLTALHCRRVLVLEGAGPCCPASAPPPSTSDLHCRASIYKAGHREHRHLKIESHYEQTSVCACPGRAGTASVFLLCPPFCFPALPPLLVPPAHGWGPGPAAARFCFDSLYQSCEAGAITPVCQLGKPRRRG